MRKVMISCGKCNGTGEIIKEKTEDFKMAIPCTLCDGSGHSGHYMTDEPTSSLEGQAKESELENAYRRSGVWDESVSREEWRTLRKIAQEEGRSYFEVKSDYLAEKKKHHSITGDPIARQMEREAIESRERYERNMINHDLMNDQLMDEEVYHIEKIAKDKGLSYSEVRHDYMKAKENGYIPMYADGYRPEPCVDPEETCIYSEQEQAEMNETYMGPPRNYDDLKEGLDEEGCPEPTEDIINKPSHYHDGGIDVLELLKMKFGPEVIRGFYIGNVIKYTLRFEKKNGVQDLEKGLYYLQALIDHERGR
jgi:hypothetical protein